LLKSQWDSQRWANQRESATLPGRIEKIRERIASIEADIADQVDVRGNRFSMVIDGKRYSERSAAGEALQRYYIEGHVQNPKVRELEILTGSDVGWGSLPASSSTCPSPRYPAMARVSS
jgi:hypothetical protein